MTITIAYIFMWCKHSDFIRFMNDVLSTHVELTLSENILKVIDNLTDMVFCVYCFFTAGSEAGGCAVEMES